MRLWYFRTVRFPFYSAEMFDPSTTIFNWFFTTAVFCILIGVCYEYLKKRYRYWSDIGIPGPKPTLIIGNMKESLFLKCTEPEMMDAWYRDHRDKPYIGFYNLLKPSLLIMDPELIRNVTEIDFNHFVDHPPLSGNLGSDSIINSLFTMKGESWKVKRSIFSRMFTPKKLREQAELLNLRYSFLKQEVDRQSELDKDTELLKLVGRYILMSFGTILYGIDLTKDEGLFEDMERYSEMILYPKTSSVLMFLFYATSPDIFNFLGLKTFPPEVWNYFSPFTKELLEYNKKLDNAKVSALVSLLNQYQDSDTPSAIDHSEAVGHIFSFLSASNHTTITTVSYGLFMLAQNPQVQDKLREEVDRVVKGNEVTTENIIDMPYLDAVLNGLRMAAVSFKVAVARLISDYIILPTSKTTFPVKYDRRSLFITCMPENGLWVKFQKRDVRQ